MMEPHEQETLEAAPAEETVDRRAMMAGALTLGVVGLAATSEAQSGGDAILKLLGRATYGPTAAEVAEASQLGFTAWLEKQLTMPATENSVCENEVRRRWPRVFMNSDQLSQAPDDWYTSVYLQDATFYRMVYSKRQLFERLCEFFRDHLSMYIWKVGGWQFVDDQNLVIRKHALGKFPDMLRASAHSGGMMVFLDNAYSAWWGPNQNYAREFFELHTMGVTGGYTQSDVLNATACWTGWSYYFQWDNEGPVKGMWRYRADWHMDGVKTVLGRGIPAGGGVHDSETIIGVVATHPSTARFLSKKMVRFFLGDGPFSAIETAVTDTYRRTGGDIKAMVRTILTPANIAKAAPKLKRPNTLYASIIRQSGAKLESMDWIRWSYINQAGQEIFNWPAPNGYPDANGYWSGYLLPRWNMPLALMANWLHPTIKLDANKLVLNATTPAALVAAIERVFFAGAMPSGDRARLLQYATGKTIDEWTRRETVALALCTPSYQWM